jgi:hypothetical protein
MFVQFMWTGEPQNGSPGYPGQHYWVQVNLGQLAAAAVFAMIACLVLGVLVAAFLADEKGAVLDAPRVASGLAAAAVGAAALAAGYAVVASFLFAVPPGSFLRWSVLPLLPVLIVVALGAVVARRIDAPAPGWLRWLRFPVLSLVFIASGVALLGYSETATRWPQLILLLEIAGRAAGLLVGVGLTLAVVSRPLFRVIVGTPLSVFCLAIADWRAAGIFGVMFGLAVAVWLATRMWTVRASPRAAAHGR